MALEEAAPDVDPPRELGFIFRTGPLAFVADFRRTREHVKVDRWVEAEMVEGMGDEG